MQGERKKSSDCDAFSNEYILKRKDKMQSFPDYIDYLFKGSIVRKIGVMGYLQKNDDNASFIAISQEEYADFVKNTIKLVVKQFVKNNLD